MMVRRLLARGFGGRSEHEEQQFGSCCSVSGSVSFARNAPLFFARPRGPALRKLTAMRETLHCSPWRSILFALSLGLASACGSAVKPGEKGLRYHALRTPGLETRVRSEGYYFHWAWNDVVSYDVTLQSRDENVEVLTSDDLHVPTVVTVTFRVEEERLNELHTTIGVDYYEEIIGPSFTTLARAEFAKFAHNDLARESPKIEAAIFRELQQSLAGKPLLVDAVSIKHIRYDPSLSQAISLKLAKEQEAEQRDYDKTIAEKDAEIARTRAKGIADAVRIRAAGDAEATVIAGKAQEEAQGAIGKTLTTRYLQYKAFDGGNVTYYFAPIGRDGLPIIVNAEPGKKGR